MSATGGASGNPVTFTVDGSSTSGACSLVGPSLSYTGVGSCIIDANQSGNAAYLAAPQVQRTIAIGKGAQTITPSTPPTNVTIFSPAYSPAGTGGASGNPVVITLDPSSMGCTLSAGVVTFASAGTCIIDFNQAGTADYSAAPQVQQTIVIGKAPQTITFTPPAGGTVGGGTTLTATGGDSGNAVNFTIDPSSTAGTCSLVGTALFYGGPGNCVVDANQPGNSNYLAAPQVQHVIIIGKAPQTIIFTPPAAGTVGGGTTLSATGGASGNPVAFTIDPSSTSGACSLAGIALSYTGAGSCVVDANQAGSAAYLAAPQVQQTIVIGKASQTITASAPPTGVTVGSPNYVPTKSGGASGQPVVVTLDPLSTGCTFSGGAVTFAATGTCVIDFNQSGNANYSAAPQVQQTMVIGKGVQTISPSTPPTNVTIFSPTYTPTGTGGASGNPVVVSLDPLSSGCTLSGGVVTFALPGTCIVDLNQAGTSDYTAVPRSSRRSTSVQAAKPSHSRLRHPATSGVGRPCQPPAGAPVIPS